MGKKNLIIIGGSEHSRVVIDAALTEGKWNVVGFLDPDDCQLTVSKMKIKNLGSDEDLSKLLKDYPNCSFILGIGADAKVRQKISQYYDQYNIEWATVIHSEAVISEYSKIEKGAVVFAKSVIQPGAEVKAHCIVNTGVIVEHDCVLEPYSHLSPGVVLGGGCQIGEGALLGIGSRVKDHISIGKNAIVGGGSVVVANVGEAETVVGVPAKKIRSSKNILHNIEDLCIPSNLTIYEAMSVLAKTGENVVFVVDDNKKVLGLLTNGDVRNLLLSNGTIDTFVSEVMNKDFIYSKEGISRLAALQQMESLNKDVLPILDSKGRIIGIHFLKDFIGEKSLPNKAVIMAGGRGTRLGDLTEHIPKPMIKVAGRPILEHIVMHLVGSGIKEIFISVNYLSEIIEDHFENGQGFGCHIRYLRETKPLGSAGALSLIPEEVKEPILLMNGDLITQFDVEAMLLDHGLNKNMMTIGMHDHAVKIPYGVLELEGESVVGLKEKPIQHFPVNAGVYAIGPELLKQVPEESEYFATQLIEFCLDNKFKLGCYLLEGDWIDVGQKEQLNQARGYN